MHQHLATIEAMKAAREAMKAAREATKAAQRDAALAEEDRRTAVARLGEEAAEVARLRGLLQEEYQISADLRAALEKANKEAEDEVARLRGQVAEVQASVPGERERAVAEFKSSAEMRNLKLEFGQAAFNSGFELCQKRLMERFPDLDLSFLEEASDDEVADAAADPPPAGASTSAAAAEAGPSGVPSSPPAGASASAAAAEAGPSGVPSSPSAPEHPVEAHPLPQGIPLKLVIKGLRGEVRRLTGKLKKAGGELCRLRRGYAKATGEVTRLRKVHKEGFMEYSRKKVELQKELADFGKRASDRSWTQASKISSLKKELGAAQEKIQRLEGTSAWSSAQEDQGWDWSERFSELQEQLRDAESRHHSHQLNWRRQLDDYRRRLKASDDEVLRLKRLSSEGASVVHAQDFGELRSLRETMGQLSECLGEEKAEVQRLRIQMVREQQAVKDAEAESEVLRKRLRVAESRSQQFHNLYKDLLYKEKDLKQEVERLKQASSLAESPRSEEAEPPTELP